MSTNVLQLICSTGFYGAERWVLALLNNIQDLDINCHLALTLEGGENDSNVIEKFDHQPWELHQIRMTSRFDFSVIRKLSKLVSEQEIEIIHSHGYKSDVIALIVAKLNKVKCVSTPHGFGIDQNFKLKAYIGLGLQCLKFFDNVVPLSLELLQILKLKNFKTGTLKYIANGVDLSEIEPVFISKDVKKNTDKQIIGYIGQLNPRKNISHILDAFNVLWQSNPLLELYLVGDGESRQQLELQAKGLTSGGNINFTGFTDQRLSYLAKFDLFIMTSTSEGIPRCMMEAMAMEVAVVAYNIKGVDQLINHRETGMLANLNDVNTLTNACNAVLSSSTLRLNLAKQGRQKIIDEFSAEAMANQYAQLFKNLLAPSQKGSNKCVE